MVYTAEITKKLLDDYGAGLTVAELAQELKVPERSIIAKLSSLGVYQKQPYLNKRGEVPVKKSQHIDTIAQHLGVAPEVLESLSKVNKQVLVLISQKLKPDPKLQ